MTNLRSWMIGMFAACVALAGAQSWSGEYEKGLEAGKKGDWAAARAAFQQAVAYRPEDTDKATTLPGPVTEPRRWRNGAPYSPNFLAAYSGYRLGMGQTGEERATTLKQSASELEVLLNKGQTSRETFYFLNAIYTTLGETAKRQELEGKFAGMSGKTTFKVDTEIVSPEEIALIASLGGPADTGQGAVKTIPKTEPAKDGGTTTQPTNSGTVGSGGLNPLVGPVAPIATKYALIIGNGDSKIADLKLAFAADDAQQMREALITNAGYPEQNVDLVLNATAEQIIKSAQALADRVDENSTVFIYFSGVGVNVGGKDYLAGIDSESLSNTGTMAAKGDVFRLFLSKGAKVFSFFQASRPVVGGRYFGQEVPLVGGLAQIQSTMPGATAQSFVRNGKTVGLFTNAMVLVMAEQRSNQLPILEFGWQVFYKMRRGDTGTTGGSSQQTPTLPVLTNLAADARF